MNRKKIVLIAVTSIILILIAVVFTQFPKPMKLMGIDLTKVEDGVYEGICENGMVAVTVEVRVTAHAITDIALLKHQNGKGKPGEAIINDVIAQQSLDVDAVSGATMSSSTILKAIENALEQGIKE